MTLNSLVEAQSRVAHHKLLLLNVCLKLLLTTRKRSVECRLQWTTTLALHCSRHPGIGLDKLSTLAVNLRSFLHLTWGHRNRGSVLAILETLSDHTALSVISRVLE